MTNTSNTLSAEQIAADTARILDIEVGELDATADLTDYGLDSLRLMTLVDKWRDGGADVDFVSLASAPILDRWTEALVGTGGPAGGAR